MLHPVRFHAEAFRYKGMRLVGTYTAPESRRPVPGVLLLHGFPGAEQNSDVARELLKRGIATFAVHFAGAWGSEGIYRFSKLPEQAEAALAHFARKKVVDPRRLGVFGFSMGGWTAVHLGARARRLRAVAAVSPVGGPEMLSPGLREFLKKSSRVLRIESLDDIHWDFVRSMLHQDPADSAKKIKAPLMIVHGDADDVVPFSSGRRIYAAARGRKTFVRARGADHSFLDRRAWLARRVADWLAACLKR